MVSVINAQTSIECTDDLECADQDITRSQITCSGDDSCARSNLTSINRQSGFIECSGAKGCDYGDINAAGTVYCESNHACRAATSINARNLDCSAWYACQHSQGQLSADVAISCTGYVSCWSSVLRPGKRTICDGYRACQDTNIVGGTQSNNV